MNLESAATVSDIQPAENDVLLGRVATVFHHPGNRRYREIIALNLRRYKEAKTRLDKMVLIRQITDQVLDDGKVRFLRHDYRSGGWTEVPFRLAQDKVSHALRDGINKSIFSPLLPENESSTQISCETARLAATMSSGPSSTILPYHSDVSRVSMLNNTAHSSLPNIAHIRFPAENSMNLNSHRFSPAVRLESMALATATTRAALSKMNFLSRVSHPPPIAMPLLQNLPRPHHPSVDRPHMHNRILPPLISAPVPANFGPRSVIGLSLPASRPLLEAAGFSNARLPFLSQRVDKIMPPTNHFLELMASKERNHFVNQQLAARREILQSLQRQQEENTKSFLNEVVQRYSQASTTGSFVADDSTGKQRAEKGSNRKDDSSSTNGSG